MATIKQWEDDLLDTMSTHNIHDIEKVLETLSNWQLYRKEYPEVDTLLAIAKNAAHRATLVDLGLDQEGLE